MKNNSINFSDGRNTPVTAIIRSVLPAGSIWKIYSDKRTGKYSRRYKVSGNLHSYLTAAEYAKEINKHLNKLPFEAVCEVHNDIIVYVK